MKNQNTNKNIKEEKKMTNKEMNTVTLSKFGKFIKRYATGTEKLTLSKSSLIEAGELTQDEVKNIINLVNNFYVAIGVMMDLRQSKGKTGNDEITLEELRNAEKIVKEYSDNWFLEVGTRPAKVEGDNLRPAYGTTYADYAIYGECVGQSMLLAKNDITKVTGHFFEILVMNTARILNGEALGRISKEELNKAKEEFNKAKNEKAAKTKKENKQKANESGEEIESLKEENTILKQEIEILKNNAINASELIAMISKMDAKNLEAQKREVINFITSGKSSEESNNAA